MLDIQGHLATAPRATGRSAHFQGRGFMGKTRTTSESFTLKGSDLPHKLEKSPPLQRHSRSRFVIFVVDYFGKPGGVFHKCSVWLRS